ncbi:hypothetical protein LJR219_001313 [Phenylobacterium sp. LjRoot219]|uniref:hypothetical protein n=1 Tax=Phenylobacterium sp. LjRoot219 TaxID=3342283 RepID=UPI003ECF905A
MFVVNGRIKTRASFEEVAKQMEAGIGPIVMGQPGFCGYYVIHTGDRTGEGVLVFDSADDWAPVKDEVVAWFKANISPLLESDGPVAAGECIVVLEPHAAPDAAGAASGAEARPH